MSSPFPFSTSNSPAVIQHKRSQILEALIKAGDLQPEWLEVEKGKIYECTARKAISYTPEGEDAITGYLYLYDEVKVSLKDIKDAIEEIRSAISQECSESGSTEIDEDEIDAIINGVDTAAPYITFYSEAEGETETAYRYTEGDVSADDSELGVSHTCFSRVDGQRSTCVEANGSMRMATHRHPIQETLMYMRA